MPSSIIFSAIAALAISAGAPTPGTPVFPKPTHPMCRNEVATDAYARVWREDLAAAVKAGTVTADQGAGATAEMTAAADGITSAADLSGFCYKLDELRAKYKF